MTYIRQFAKNNNYNYTLATFDIAKVSSNVVVVQIFSMSQKFRYQVFFFHVLALVSIWTDIPNMDKTDKQANCLKLKKVEIKGGELELKQMVSGSGWMAACSLRPCADNIIHCKVHILTSLFFQTVFADQPQVAYIQQDGTTQQVSLSAIVKLPALFCTTLFLENP